MPIQRKNEFDRQPKHLICTATIADQFSISSAVLEAHPFTPSVDFFLQNPTCDDGTVAISFIERPFKEGI